MPNKYTRVAWGGNWRCECSQCAHKAFSECVFTLAVTRLNLGRRKVRSPSRQINPHIHVSSHHAAQEIPVARYGG